MTSMIPARRLLVPIDFSECARRALEHAAFLKRCFHGRIDVLHVVAHVPELEHGEAFVRAIAGESGESFRAHAIERARRELEIMLASMSDVEVDALHVSIGRPAETIVASAQEMGADLIVMGTHGRTGLRRVAMGSVAEQVLRHARCPVLTVRVPTDSQQEAYA